MLKKVCVCGWKMPAEVNVLFRIEDDVCKKGLSNVVINVKCPDCGEVFDTSTDYLFEKEEVSKDMGAYV